VPEREFCCASTLPVIKSKYVEIASARILRIQPPPAEVDANVPANAVGQANQKFE
jgi:hypothetical protein